MRIIRKINNNVAIGLDKDDREVVVFGKGVGFGPAPYELTDLSRIERTFYDIDSRYYGLLNEIPEHVILLVTKLLDAAKAKIGGNWNPNTAFIIADHVNFAMERYKKGMHVPLPYSYELEYEHPEVTEISKWFVNRINERLRVSLGDGEVTSITMHLLNATEGRRAESGAKYPQETIKRVVEDITDIIQARLNIEVDRKSFHYFRFKNHLKYFLQRKARGEEFVKQKEELYESVKSGYPEVFACVAAIDDYFVGELRERCPHEELLYLMIHIIQLYTKEDCNRKGITSEQ